MTSASQLVKTYGEKLTGVSSCEVIQVQEDARSAADAWALKEKFPWLLVHHTDVGRDILKHKGNTAPNYVLLNLKGHVLAKGKFEAFEKMGRLTKK